jgi:hypothetical protein
MFQAFAAVPWGHPVEDTCCLMDAHCMNSQFRPGGGVLITHARTKKQAPMKEKSGTFCGYAGVKTSDQYSPE